MFGFKHFKAKSTRFVIRYRGGKVVAQGRGLEFFYRTAVTSIVEIPMESVEIPFIFNETSSDFQELSVQGQFTYQIAAPEKTAALLDFTTDGRRYLSEDYLKLPERILNIVQELVMREVERLPLREALTSGSKIAEGVFARINSLVEIQRLGVDILGLRVVAIRPNPETARALEAGMREEVQQEADEAAYRRRNAAVEQERVIRENELQTEIATQEKQRQIMEKRLQGEREEQEARSSMRKAEVESQVFLEKKKQELFDLRMKNERAEAETEALRVSAIIGAYNSISPALVEAMKYGGMNPTQLLADGFRELAKNSSKIGQINVSPDLVSELVRAGGALRAGPESQGAGGAE